MTNKINIMNSVNRLCRQWNTPTGIAPLLTRLGKVRTFRAYFLNQTAGLYPPMIRSEDININVMNIINIMNKMNIKSVMNIMNNINNMNNMNFITLWTLET